MSENSPHAVDASDRHRAVQDVAHLMTDTPEPLDTFAVVELMGHVTIIGAISEATIAGAAMLRIQRLDGRVQHVGAQSLYRVTECTEDEARRAHQLEQHRYYGPAGLPNSLARAVMDAPLMIGAGDDDDDPYTEAGHDEQRAEMDRQDRRNEDHDDEDLDDDEGGPF